MSVSKHRLVLGLAAGVCALTLVAGCGGGSRSASSTSTDGATLVGQLCGRCHPIDRVQAAKKDRTGWTATLDRMVSHGLNVDAAQKTAIVDYLTRRDGGQ